MFSNIGGKIKALAQFCTWAGIIASVLTGAMILQNPRGNYVVGVAIIVFGSLISWISSFVLYGFGQLVQNSDAMVKDRNVNAYENDRKE